MNKYISFSLWGDDLLYIDGMTENIKLAPLVYPGWTVIVYVSEDCPVLSYLKTLDCELVVMPKFMTIDREKDDWVWQFEHTAMFWRYYILDDMKEGDVVIIRDADSRLSKREADVVNHWLTTPYIACRIAENASHHNSFAMSGMMGFRGGYLSHIKESIDEWISYYKTLNHPWMFVDLEYNTNVLAPIIGRKTIGYGYGHPNPLPPLKEGELFIGEVVDGHKRGQKYRLP